MSFGRNALSTRTITAFIRAVEKETFGLESIAVPLLNARLQTIRALHMEHLEHDKQITDLKDSCVDLVHFSRQARTLPLALPIRTDYTLQSI